MRDRIELAGWLVSHTHRLLPPLVLSVLARIANQLLGVALLGLAAAALGRAAAGTPPSAAVLAGSLTGIALAKAGLRYLEHYTGHWVAFTALQRLRELFYSRLAPQAPAATTGRAGAELTERATRDIDRIEVFFAHTFPPAVSAVVVPAIALTWLGTTVDGALAAAIALFLAVALLIPLWASGATWRAARGVATRRGELAAHVGDDVQGVREVLAFGAEQARLHGLEEHGRALTAARVAAGRIQAARTATTTLLHALTLIAPLTIAVAAGVPPAGIAVALAVAVGLWGPTRGIDGFTSGLDAVFAATTRIREIIDAEPLVRDPDRPGPAPTGAGVELDAVTVRYPGSAQDALEEVTVSFPPGAWSVVVGVSGSGKSTLATLLARGLDPRAGTVRIGGVDARTIPLGDLRRRIALVSQHPTLLSGTIADNLRLASPDADETTLHEAVAIAALEKWIASLPRGLDTPMRERGLTVSGGQLQRLALARAVAAEPQVLVLDEALSQLDADTARTVRRRLITRRPALTIIEVTHRADLVPGDAPVIVLDRGRVVESGAAAALRPASGAFAHLEARL